MLKTKKLKLVVIFAVLLLSACREDHWNDCQCELNNYWSIAYVEDGGGLGPVQVTKTLDVSDGVGEFESLHNVVDQNFLDGSEVLTFEFLSCESALFSGFNITVNDGIFLDTAFVYSNEPLLWQFYDGCNALILERESGYRDTLYLQ